MAELVITAVGSDRPGLVGKLTGRLMQMKVNIADSRMVNLRGRFAILLLVEADDTALETLRLELPAIGEEVGLQIESSSQTKHLLGNTAVNQEEHPSRTTQTQKSVIPVSAGVSLSGVPYRLRTYSLDQPGIVHRVTNLLYQHGVNIEELATRLESAPFAGTPLFTMDIRVTVPVAVSIKQLRQELETLCDTLNCDLDWEPA